MVKLTGLNYGNDNKYFISFNTLRLVRIDEGKQTNLTSEYLPFKKWGCIAATPGPYPSPTFYFK